LDGADHLDIESQKISLAQQEQIYANYFVRSPIDGIVGRIPVNILQQASNGTVVATIINEQKGATISLNEVDASKVRTGNPVQVTFDALEDLTAEGTVSEVDLVARSRRASSPTTSRFP